MQENIKCWGRGSKETVLVAALGTNIVKGHLIEKLNLTFDFNQHQINEVLYLNRNLFISLIFLDNNTEPIFVH